MSTIGRTIRIKGELHVAGDLAVEGQVDGSIWCEGFAVTIQPGASVTGDVIAADITVFGHVDGQLVASDVVDIREVAAVTGSVVTPRFILNEGAQFTGRAEPQHLEAALRVKRFNLERRVRNADDASPPPARIPR
jgi:cytoskeletal protein CcmA (bactofilin family)